MLNEKARKFISFECKTKNMNPSFIYHAFGVKGICYSSTEYKNSSIYINIRSSQEAFRCPVCKSRNTIKYGTVLRDFRCVPIGRKPVILRMNIQRVQCKECQKVNQEEIPFTTGKRSYTHRFARYVISLLRIGTIKDVANFLRISWDTVKEIHKKYLHNHYASPKITDVVSIGIDEFAIAKGHVYKTIVVDLDTGHIIHVGDGKGKDSLTVFWKKVKRQKANIKNIATDLSAAFISSVMENVPDANLVFDHFHVVKLANDALDKVRRETYRDEKDLNKRKVIKGTRWLLLGNGKDIFDGKHKTRLENALNLNLPITKAYYLKEELREIWMQENKEQAEIKLDDWVQQAKDSKVQPFIKLANTIMAHRTGILAWYDCRISTGKVEGINNKIKVMKRAAYGFRDQEYIKLRLLGLHDKTNAFIG